MLIIGTSSVVYPAASLPERAKENGAKLIEINPASVTPLAKLVNLHLQATAADALTTLLEMMS